MKRSIVTVMGLLLAACSDAGLTGTDNISVRFTDLVVGASATEAVLPSAYTSMMGETNNSFPHSVKNLRYQQVFAGSDVVNPVINGLCLRRDDVVTGAERVQTLTILLGPTSLDYTTLGADFAANYSSAPTQVFQGDVVIPASDGLGTPGLFDFCISFTQEYTHPAGSNIIVEVLNTSAVSGNVVRDACAASAVACTTSRAFAFSTTAETAALVARGGLVMKFVSPPPPPPPPEVDPLDVTAKSECMKGGWADFGFKNQGQCVRFIETGIDSRS